MFEIEDALSKYCDATTMQIIRHAKGWRNYKKIEIGCVSSPKIKIVFHPCNK